MSGSQSNEHDLIERFQALLPAATAIKKSAATVQRLTKKLGTPEGYEALKTLQRDLDALADAALDPSDLLAQAKAAAADVATWLTGEWERRGADFAARLTEYFEDRQVTLGGEGLELCADPIQIRLLPQQDRAVLLFGGEVVKDRVPLRASRIYDEWQRAQDRLAREGTPPETFADALVHAYDEVCLLRQKTSAVRLRLTDVHFQLFVHRQTAAVRQDPRRSRVKEYPRYQFAWDLSALLEYPEWLEHGGRTIEVFPASDSASRSRSASLMCRAGGADRLLGDIRIG